MNYVALIMWLSKLGSDAPRLIEYAQGITRADDVLTGWAAVKQFGDAAVPHLAEFPELAFALDVEAQQATEHQLQAAGVDTAGLKDLLPIFEQFLLPLLLRWLASRGK